MVRHPRCSGIGLPFLVVGENHNLLSIGYDGGLSGGDLRRRGFLLRRWLPDQRRPARGALWRASCQLLACAAISPASSYGDQMHVLNLEYRFPLLWIERGYETLPGFPWRLHGAAYSDIGTAFLPVFLDKFNVAFYGELRLDGKSGLLPAVWRSWAMPTDLWTARITASTSAEQSAFRLPADRLLWRRPRGLPDVPGVIFASTLRMDCSRRLPPLATETGLSPSA